MTPRLEARGTRNRFNQLAAQRGLCDAGHASVRARAIKTEADHTAHKDMATRPSSNT